jgi:GxxExxY protein
VLIDDRIVYELKSVEFLTPLFVAQILTQLKLADLDLGFLINFNVSLIKEGTRRIIR